MSKFLIGFLILAPLVAAAAGMSMGGDGFDAGGGPPQGESAKPPADPEELLNRATLAREKAAYAADLLYPAAEKLFALAGEVTALPTLSCRWEVAARSENESAGDEAAAGGDPLATYRREFDACRTALNAAWKNKRERTKIIDRLKQSPDAVLAARDDLKAAVEISKTAGDELDEIASGFQTLKDMAGGRPGMGGMPPGRGKMPSDADVAAMEKGAKDAAALEKTGKDLLKKVKAALK
jgi:hypothetical protein